MTEMLFLSRRATQSRKCFQRRFRRECDSPSTCQNCAVGVFVEARCVGRKGYSKATEPCAHGSGEVMLVSGKQKRNGGLAKAARCRNTGLVTVMHWLTSSKRCVYSVWTSRPVSTRPCWVLLQEAGVHGWILAALFSEMNDLNAMASFESCGTEFRFSRGRQVEGSKRYLKCCVLWTQLLETACKE